jgi:chromosome segregation ATPase
MSGTSRRRRTTISERLENALKERDSLLKERDSLRHQIEGKEEELMTRTSEIESLKTCLTEEINSRMELEERLRAATIKEIKVDDLSSHFTDTLRGIQRDLDKEEKGLRYYVDRLDVEVKAGMGWEEGLKLIQPKMEELKPENLSTLKISFKSSPRLKIAKESKEKN